MADASNALAEIEAAVGELETFVPAFIAQLQADNAELKRQNAQLVADKAELERKTIILIEQVGLTPKHLEALVGRIRAVFTPAA